MTYSRLGPFLLDHFEFRQQVKVVFFDLVLALCNEVRHDQSSFVSLTVLIEHKCSQLGIICLLQSLLDRPVSFVEVLEFVVHQLLNLRLVLIVGPAL